MFCFCSLCERGERIEEEEVTEEGYGVLGTWDSFVGFAVSSSK